MYICSGQPRLIKREGGAFYSEARFRVIDTTLCITIQVIVCTLVNNIKCV